MQYRSEIDGLRAIAVVPVILFHAGFSVFSGGYVGVAIFFVISGYLITGIILKGITAGNFNLLNFYERRARRILPALILVVVVSILFAWSLMFPLDLKVFSHGVFSVATFSFNILFWLSSDYFATSTAFKPLLHT